MKKLLTILTSLTVFTTLTVLSPALADFNDLHPGDQYYQAITTLQQKGVISGYQDNTVHPERSINRAEFLKLVFTAAKIASTSSGTACFKDVVGNEWYAPYLCTAKSLGIVSGLKNGTFQPGRNINRAEAIKIIINAFKIPLSKTNSCFADVAPQDWYSSFVATAQQGNFLEEKGSLNPGNDVTRGEASEILYRIITAKDAGKDRYEIPYGFGVSGATYCQITSFPSDVASKLKKPDHYRAITDNLPANLSPEDYINRYREFFNLPALKINDKVRLAAQKHSVYIDNSQDRSLGAHIEISGKPGYVAADSFSRCKAAGYDGLCLEVVAWDFGDMKTAIDWWMNSLYHRPPLIARGSGDIGCGQTNRWYVCEIAISTTLDPLPEVTFPAPGQTVSGEFKFKEEPRNAYPEQYFGQFIGTTVLYWPSKQVASIQYGLFNLASHQSYELILPESVTDIYNEGGLIFNAKAPLPAGVEILVVVRGTNTDGSTFEKYWSFKTQ